MTTEMTRRRWLKTVSAAAGALTLERRVASADTVVQTPTYTPSHGDVIPLTSTSEVVLPPRGHSFMKFSFDFPEPSVEFDGLRFAINVFTQENAYALDAERMRVDRVADGIDLTCDGLLTSGGQEKRPGLVTARFRRAAAGLEWTMAVDAGRTVKAVTTVIRGVPQGRISAAGAEFFDPLQNEVLLAYPFSGSDLFGPGASGGLPTPLVIIERTRKEYFAISSLDDRVRTKRFYFQPGETTYRAEAVHEVEGWTRATRVEVPSWRITRGANVDDVSRPHFDHIERAYGLPRWDTREDVPGWARRIALVVTLHGMHYTGYVFNDYARMLDTLRWIAARFPAERVLAFISAWDGRYYWDYPEYRASERMGGEAGFRALIRGAQGLGFHVMPMFGANAANREQPSYAGVRDAFTERIDGDRFDLDWVDWDNDRHQDGWLSYMNLGVESWRRWLAGRISDAIERYGIDAYFLDIVGGWVNNPRADMHEGTRRLVLDLRARYPHVLACGEMHYDALMSFIPLYHSFGQTLVANRVQEHARFFQHLSHPAPGRGSTGVHEAGFVRWNPTTLSLSEYQIPTLNVVDDTFTKYRDVMDAVIQKAKQRARI